MTSKKSDNNKQFQVKELLSILRFSKKVIIFSFVCVVLFTVVMTVLIAMKDRDFETLIEEFFSYFKLEGGILGVLKFIETVMDGIARKLGSSSDETKSNEDY